MKKKYFCINAEVEFSEYILLKTWDPELKATLGTVI